MKRMVLVIISICIALSCNSEEYRVAKQKLGINLSAYAGGTIIKITKQRDLLNAFGKKDVFGGKVEEGYIEVKYLGKTTENSFALGITEITIESNETTMSRYGKANVITNLQTTKDYFGNYITTGNVYFVNKPADRTYILPPDYTDFIWDFSIGKEYEIEGYLITFISFNENQLKYIITNNK